jgi:excinuclease UvrABC nuclease subunit
MSKDNTTFLNQLPSIPFSERKKLPSCCAVYFAIGPDNKVLYVGAAVNLRRRWWNHHRDAQLESMGCIKLSWLECPKESLLNKENEMIMKFRLLLNQCSRNAAACPDCNSTNTYMTKKKHTCRHCGHSWNRTLTF